jgi:hypothetical protein
MGFSIRTGRKKPLIVSFPLDSRRLAYQPTPVEIDGVADRFCPKPRLITTMLIQPMELKR